MRYLAKFSHKIFFYTIKFYQTFFNNFKNFLVWAGAQITQDFIHYFKCHFHFFHLLLLWLKNLFYGPAYKKSADIAQPINVDAAPCTGKLTVANVFAPFVVMVGVFAAQAAVPALENATVTVGVPTNVGTPAAVFFTVPVMSQHFIIILENACLAITFAVKTADALGDKAQFEIDPDTAAPPHCMSTGVASPVVSWPPTEYIN